MKFFSYIQSLGFTRNEIRVVLMLSCTFLLGLAVKRYYFPVPPSDIPEKQFDYSIPDSIFLERSKKSTGTFASEGSGADSVGNTTRRKPSRGRKVPQSIVNINRGSRSDLMQLPGIGAVYAERIIAYRSAHGPFTAVDDLVKVKGIGKKRLERLRQFVSVK